MSATVRALGAFSGGLDSRIAAKLLADQGIDVLLVTFTSPFFSSDHGREGAALLSLSWREEEFTEEIMALLADPPSGFGSCLNPCIDCHAAMLAKLGGIMRAEGFDFVFSGEVLGQRPMSQSAPSLNRVANLSGIRGRLLRPLSAKLLPPTKPELEGLVDRERLLGMNGRGRKPQIELAKRWGLQFPPPAGGCRLTDPGYCRRLGALRDSGLSSPLNARLIRSGRMFRLGPASFLVLGRDERENNMLEELSEGSAYRLQDLPGPSAVLIGEEVPHLLVASLIALYCRKSGPGTFCVNTPGGGVVQTLPADMSTAERLVIR